VIPNSRFDRTPNSISADSSPPSLLPKDLAEFEKLRIPTSLLADARIQRVTDAEARSEYGITGPVTHSMSGVLFPYYSPVTGYRTTARLRRDHPEIDDGKPKGKYLAPYGDPRHLYFPPNAQTKLADLSIPIVLVEAEKSALALTAWSERMSTKILPLGTGGCWAWRGVIGKTEDERGERVDVLGPLADLSYCNDRKVYILFDSNASTNAKVQAARAALAAHLRQRKCEVLVCELPAVQGVNGPDDYIFVCGDDAMAEVLADVEEKRGKSSGASRSESRIGEAPRKVEIGLFTKMPSKFFGSGTASNIGPSAALIFLALCEHANRRGSNTFRASDRALASDTKYGPRTICNARKTLIERGLIECSREEGQSFTYTIPVLDLQWKPLAERPRKPRRPRALHAGQARIP